MIDDMRSVVKLSRDVFPLITAIDDISLLDELCTVLGTGVSYFLAELN